jgi:hypothetical protein
VLFNHASKTVGEFPPPSPRDRAFLTFTAWSPPVLLLNCAPPTTTALFCHFAKISTHSHNLTITRQGTTYDHVPGSFPQRLLPVHSRGNVDISLSTHSSDHSSRRYAVAVLHEQCDATVRATLNRGDGACSHSSRCACKRQWHQSQCKLPTIHCCAAPSPITPPLRRRRTHEDIRAPRSPHAPRCHLLHLLLSMGYAHQQFPQRTHQPARPILNLPPPLTLQSLGTLPLPDLARLQVRSPSPR